MAVDQVSIALERGAVHAVIGGEVEQAAGGGENARPGRRMVAELPLRELKTEIPTNTTTSVTMMLMITMLAAPNHARAACAWTASAPKTCPSW